MPDDRTYGFGKDDAEALLQGIGSGDTWFPETRPRGNGSRRSAVLAEDLTAPADSLAVATECNIYFIDLKSDGTQEVIDGIVVAYNDDPQLTGDMGTYCRVERLNGRWMFYYLSCTTQEALTDAIEAMEAPP